MALFSDYIMNSLRDTSYTINLYIFMYGTIHLLIQQIFIQTLSVQSPCPLRAAVSSPAR